MMLLRLTAFVSSCLAVAHGSNSDVQYRPQKHQPDSCKPKVDARAVTQRQIDRLPRNDDCCSTPAEASCAPGYLVQETSIPCSKHGAQVRMLEFKCYHDNSEFPTEVMIAIMAVFGLLLVIASIAHRRYMQYVARPAFDSKAVSSDKKKQSFFYTGMLSDLLARLLGSSSEFLRARASRSSKSSEAKEDTLPWYLQQDGDAIIDGAAMAKGRKEAKAADLGENTPIGFSFYSADEEEKLNKTHL
mmetsp:Transcript_143159/g.252669  ORF Transcript_143159/g.252669 Transcript_143159/m.252669 type:complete len:244 (-) Transcript_143159:86-817(-)